LALNSPKAYVNLVLPLLGNLSVAPDSVSSAAAGLFEYWTTDGSDRNDPLVYCDIARTIIGSMKGNMAKSIGQSTKEGRCIDCDGQNRCPKMPAYKI
jgi:hypothetical protein